MMTPPTVAPGSVIVMRRQGTSHDTAPSSFYVPSPLQKQQGSMGSQGQLHQESSGGNGKPKKSWGERLKLGKSEKCREDRQQTSPGVSSPDNNNYLLQEYRNKYGTLSSGSALSKSMKYAETWLYGSVAVRSPTNGSTPRPSLFLYHPPPPVTVIPAVIPPGTNYAVVMCSCPEFLTGTARSKKSSSAVCKKCGGSRVLWNVNKGGGTMRATGTVVAGGTVRGVGGTLRLGGGSSGQNRVRPSLLSLQTSPIAKPPSQQSLKATTPDPYDLMRRNRLGGVNNNEAMLQYDLEEGSNVQFTGTDTLRVRAKSTSPCRRRRSPSPPVIRTVFDNVHTDNGRRVSRRDLAWEREYSNWNSVTESADNSKRKSILECDVNAYELIAKYLKNGNRPAENGETKKIEGLRRPNSVDVTSDDDVLEDELSDDLSDNALENSTAGRSNIPAPRNQSQRSRVGNPTILNVKTESTSKETKHVKPANVQINNKVSGAEKVSNTSSPTRNGVTLGGQRIRIFNETSSTSSVEGDNGYVDNDISTEYSRMNGRSSVMTDKNNDTKISRQQEKYPKNTTAAATVTTSSLIPRLASPRRPPRKLKTSPDISDFCNGNNDIAEEEDENESTTLPSEGCNSVNNNHVDVAESSPSQAKDGRAATEGVCIIKSILKKPSTSPGETSTSSKTFGDTISKPDFAVSDLAVVSAASSVVTAAASSHYSPSPEAVGSSDFYLPTFQEFKQQHRKKKQVQFKVADDVTSEDNTSTARHTVNKPASSEEEKTLDVEIQNNKQPSVKINNWTSDREEPSSEPVKVERKKKDVKFSKQEEDPLENVENEVKDENVLISCDNKKPVVNDNVIIKTENSDNDGVKLKYFGEVDVNINNVLGGGAVSPDSGKGASDISTSVPHASFILGGKTSSSGDALVKERLHHGGASLRRSQSERLLPTTSGSLRGSISPQQEAQFKAEGSAALFNDTMRLRLRPGRPDIREVFSDPGPPGTYTTSDNVRGTSKRPQRMLSPGRPRPKEPPPPPPPPSSYALLPDSTQKLLPELPPRQIFPFTKKQIEQMNQQARQFSIKSNSKQRKPPSSLSKLSKSALDSETAVPSNIRPVSWSPLAEKPLINSYEKRATHAGVRKKEHRHSDPGPILPKLVVHVESSQGIEQKEPGIHVQMTSKSQFSQDQDPVNKDDSSMLNFTSKIEGRNDGKIRTIVTVSSSAPGSPLADVHRLQVRAEDPVIDVSPSPQRRTSILINGEDCMEEIRHLSFGNAASVTSLIVQEESTKISPVKKDSSNKVTISVGAASDSEIMNQSSSSSLRTVIDTSPSSTLNLSKSYSKNSSLTLLSSAPDQVNVIPVTSDQQVQRTLLVVDHNDSVERIDNMVLHCWNNSTPTNTENDVKLVNNTITIVDSVVEESSTTNIVMSKSRGIDLSLTTPDLEDVDVLLNPVEAIRRNLIPHVCGKKITISEDESDNISPTERLNKLIQLEEELNEDDKERETLKEGDYFMASAVSKLVDLNNSEETPLYSNLASTTTASKSSEDTLPTVIEQEEEEDEGDDDVFQPEPLSLEDDMGSRLLSSLEAEDSRTDDKSFTGESSGCDTAPSSIEPENEGTDGKDEDDISTSDLPLSLPFKILDTPTKEKDNQDDEVELRVKSNNDSMDADVENIYESIKDPIYEEIPDTPPPLPLSPPPSLDDLEESKRSSRSIFEGASKYDILSYLVGAKERGIVPEESYYGGSTSGDEIVEILDGKTITDDEEGGQSHERMTSLDLGDLSSRVSHLSNASDSSEDSCNLINIGETPSSPNKVRKSSAEIERNDSGVGSETSKSSRSRWQHSGPASSIREDQQHLCEDCDQPVETQVTDSGVMFAPLVCRKCGKKRAERKEIIAEIVETEEKYGRDLQIIMDEFYKPMLVAGLLSPDQLAAIFLNVEELLEHNVALAEKLRDNMEIALEQGDEDLLTVNIGKLFLEAAPMLHTFESYCIRQGAASMLLANLEKEKELLRIFLRVSQMENAVLRRMNLNSFLMVPVQRVTKYPLLLARLHKVTPAHHEGRELLRQSQHKIELHLEHMNSEAKDISTTKLWRRISIMNGRRASSETDMLSIKLRKMALDILEWNHDEVRFAMEGKLLYTNPADNNWRKGRTIKLNPINALLVTNGKPTEDYRPDPSEDALMFPRKTGVREATLLLLKEKCGRYTQLREPLYLDKCIVCSEAEWEDYFEVQELASKDTFIFKAEDGDRTKLWYRQLQYHAQGMGAWRRRRNALANIMINGMQTRN